MQKKSSIFFSLTFYFFPFLAFASGIWTKELEANRAFQKGQFQKAFSLYWQCLQSSSQEGEKVYFLARCSQIQSQWLFQTRRFSKLLKAYESQVKPEEVFLKLFLRWLQLSLAISQGKIKEARTLSQKMGFLTQWAILGAFDNERGGGYHTPYPPEKKIHWDQVFSGKKYPIRWRFHKSPALDGKISLKTLFVPSEQVLAYCVTFFYLPTPQKVLLSYSSDESFKIWLNDQLLDAQKLKRETKILQNLYALELPKGWHKICLKSMQEEGDWSFRLSLTDLFGNPIPGLITVQSLKECQNIVYSKASWKRLSFPTPMEILAQSKEPRHWHYAAYLYQRFQNFDLQSEIPLRLWRRCLSQEKNAHYALWYAQALFPKQRKTEEKDYNPFRQILEKALEWEKDAALIYFQLGNYYQTVMANPTKALRFFETALKISPDFWLALYAKMQIYERWNWPESQILRRKLFQYATPQVSYLKAQWLFQKGRVQQAEEIDKKLIQTDLVAFRKSYQRLVLLALRRGETKKAIAMLSHLLRFFPYRTELYKKILQLLRTERDYETMEVWLNQWLSLQPENSELWTEKAMLALLKGQTNLSLLYTQKALSLAPHSRKLQKLLKFLKSGKSSLEKEFAEKVSPLIQRAQRRQFSSHFPFHILLKKRVVKIYPDGTYSEFHQLLLRITNQEGKELFSTFSVPYYEGEQSVEILCAEVHRLGEVLKGKTSSFFQERQFVDFPPLYIGDILHIQYKLHLLKPTYFGNYFGTTFYFQDKVPVDRATFVVIVPKGLKVYFHSWRFPSTPKVFKKKNHTLYYWEMQNIPPLEEESYMPKPREVSPYVQVSTYPSWREFGQWYWNLIHRQMESDPEIRKKVRELTKGKKTLKEKIRSIYNYVVSKIRYSAEWEFGVHGYKPYSASAIYSRKFGDCKDKAILLSTMLKEIGVTCYPVLIRGEEFRSKEDLSLPLVEHFNHCIAYVPPQQSLKKGLFLDGTAQYHSMETLPKMDWGAKVVIVTPKGGKVSYIPYPSPEENSYRSRYTIELLPKGRAKITLEFLAKKEYTVLFREYFQNPGKRKQKWEEILNRLFGAVEVKSFSFSSLDHLAPLVQGKVIFQVENFWQHRGEQATLPPLQDPLWWIKLRQNLSLWGSTSERKHDLLLPPPTQIEVEATIEIPKGFSPLLKSQQETWKTPYASYQWSLLWKKGKIHIKKVFRLTKPRVKAKDYPSFRQFLQKIQRTEKREVFLKKS